MKTARMMLTAAAFLFILQAWVLSGQDSKIENGVTIISNPKMPVLLNGKAVNVALKEDLRIGDKPDEKNSLFYDIRGARVDNEGQIIVLDWKEVKIKIFDGNGRLIRSFGKKGKGPQEWDQPQDISLTPDHHILVFDGGNNRLSIYTRNGQCLNEIPLGTIFPQQSRMDDEGNILACILTRDRAEKTFRIVKHDPNLSPQSVLATVRANAGPAHNNTYPEWLLYEHYGQGEWIWAFTEKYEMTIIDGQGTVKKKIVKEYSPVKVTEAHKKDFIENVKKVAGEGAREILPSLVFPSAFPPIISLKTDEKQRVYVKTYETDDRGNALYDVFDAEGRYICRFSHPANENLFAVRNDEAYFIVKEDEEGLPLIKRYQLVWTAIKK